MSILDIIEGNLDPNWSVINDTSKLRLHMLSLCHFELFNKKNKWV